MVTKKVECPKCKTHITVEGKPGETTILSCPNCNLKGKYTFPKEDLPLIKTKELSSENAIVIKNCTKTFNGFKAVDNLSFNVKKGEIFGFLGPNGAGKTTTLKSLLDLIHADTGEFIINGYDIKTQQIEAKRSISFLPERVQFYENLTPAQTLNFFCELQGVDKSIVKPLLRDVGLEDVINKKVGQFSKGMVQLLGIAQALIGNPPIYIFDEPMSGLDARWVKIVREKIKALNEGGATIIFSSHILSEVEALCDRVAIIDNGKLIAEDTVPNISKYLNIKPRISIYIKGLNGKVPDIIKKLKGVEAVEAKQDILFVTCESSIRSHVITTLEKAGYTISDIKTIEPSLEEAFVKLVEEAR